MNIEQFATGIMWWMTFPLALTMIPFIFSKSFRKENKGFIGMMATILLASYAVVLLS